MAVFAISPGVYAQERDLSVRVAPAAVTIAAAVGASAKGSLGRIFNSSREQFLERYGNPDPSVGFFHHSCLAFLLEGNSLWTARVVNGAKYGAMSFVSDREGNAHKVNTPITSTIGLTKDYRSGAREVQAIIFDGPLVAANNVDVTFTVTGTINNQPVNAEMTASVVFGSDSNTTLATLANSIRSQISSIAPGAVAEVVDAGNGTNDDRVIRIFSPYNVAISVVNVRVANGVSQTTYSVEDLKLFDVIAENPGGWNNTIGVKISAVDIGIPQRLKVSFSRALVTGNNVSVTVNGRTLPVIAFNTDNDTTLANIATAIKGELGNSSQAYAEVFGGGSANDRDITIVAPDAESDVVINSITVTGGATQPNVAWEQTLERVAPDNTFQLEVYSTDDISKPVEQFTVSLGRQLDGYGVQQNIAEVINNGPRRSKYIRIFQPDWSLNVKIRNVNSSITLLNGGDDGASVRTSDLMNGWELFRYREHVDIRMMINCGYAVPAIQKKMTEIAEYRRDCFAILDIPSDQQTPQAAWNYRRNIMNINSSYAAVYTPDLEIQDGFTDRVMYIPPSGYMAGVYARTDRVAATWFAPAGLNRADLSTKILGLRQEYNRGDRDLLFPAQVNFILKMPGKGFPVWSAETLQSKPSALSNVNVRRLLIFMEISIVDVLDYSVFEPNDPFLRASIVDQVDQFAQPIKNQRGLKEYMVVSDERNNSPADEDEGVLNVEFLVKPIIPAKFIRLLTTVTRSGANFEELIMRS